ncbi:SIMPL domain-containing protein [Candidatus Thiosymbion oneisti]|uniref:SIMPL domain-containing protein n=1 Tax=Candidatus Thiosymbion oneisti TaxID=589554 RepID=UPI000AB6919A|nr:SIMPL domain-containing protein [Candidatus Thiosymbion oneisti]
MNRVTRMELLLAALLIAFGIAGGGYFIGQTLYNAKVAINVTTVKGLAERRVEADRARWKIGYLVVGGDKAEIPSLYDKSEADQAQIMALLLENGFEEKDISPGIIDYGQREYRSKNQELVEVKYSLTGSIEVATDKVELVSKVRSKVNELIAHGLNIKNNAPAYYFTRLNEIKPAMLREATKNARIAANEFAENAGVKVGSIRDAHQGGFSIRDVGESHGDTAKIEKDVRVVTTITFYLTK